MINSRHLITNVLYKALVQKLVKNAYTKHTSFSLVIVTNYTAVVVKSSLITLDKKFHFREFLFIHDDSALFLLNSQ